MWEIRALKTKQAFNSPQICELFAYFKAFLSSKFLQVSVWAFYLK